MVLVMVLKALVQVSLSERCFPRFPYFPGQLLTFLLVGLISSTCEVTENGTGNDGDDDVTANDDDELAIDSDFDVGDDEENY